MGETYPLSHVLGNGGILRHVDDGVATSNQQSVRGQSNRAQTGSKRETVEHRQPACDTLGRGRSHFAVARLPDPEIWNPPRAVSQKITAEGREREDVLRETAHASAGKRTVEIERPFCPSGHGGMNITDTYLNRTCTGAFEQCQNKQNLSLDGRMVRLIDRPDENLDALMTPIGNDDETPDVV